MEYVLLIMFCLDLFLVFNFLGGLVIVRQTSFIAILRFQNKLQLTQIIFANMYLPEEIICFYS